MPKTKKILTDWFLARLNFRHSGLMEHAKSVQKPNGFDYLGSIWACLRSVFKHNGSDFRH